MSKIREAFPGEVVKKSGVRTKFFSDLSLPSYMRDWLVMKFSDSDGNIDYELVNSYIKQYIPNREDYEHMKFRLVNGEKLRILARVRVSVDVRSGKTSFELPDFGGKANDADGVIAPYVVDEWKEVLLSSSDCWGIIDIVREEEVVGNSVRGYLRMINYEQFRPFGVDLDFYREARRSFTTEEWIDVLIGAVDYNPDGYENEAQKMCFLRRLLPFVELRVNLIELAPRGTGKSYVYEKISKRGWVVSGGSVSRASLFYNNSTRNAGLVTRFDYVAFDEIQNMVFTPHDEVQAGLTTYMQDGIVKGFEDELPGTAGIVVLGNIEADKYNTRLNMVSSINPIFHKPETLDRIHGFIPGWEIPKFHQSLIAEGWALNAEYFAEVLHELREEHHYSDIVEQLLFIPATAYIRDKNAIVRLCTAFVKLIFPHARRPSDIPAEEFIKYCLEPAKDMRQIIRNQLHVIAPLEYEMREVPDIRYRAPVDEY